jgi:hypothetical protein
MDKGKSLDLLFKVLYVHGLVMSLLDDWVSGEALTMSGEMLPVTSKSTWPITAVCPDIGKKSLFPTLIVPKLPTTCKLWRLK